MAKEDIENEDGQLDEVAEEIEPSPKKAPKPAPKKSGQIPLPLIIGGAFGCVVMIVVSVIVGTIVAQQFFPPPIVVVKEITKEVEPEEEEHADEHGGGHGAKKQKLEPIPEDEEIEDDSPLLADSDWLTFNSEKYAGNTRTPGKMAVLEFVITYKPFRVDILKHKGFLTEAGVDGHGNPTPPGVDEKCDLYKEFQRNIKSKMMLFIAQSSDAELSS
jgi:hypothetical protein